MNGIKGSQVIAPKYLPTRVPILSTWMLWLTFRVVDEPGWVTGACWAAMIVWWVITVAAICVGETRCHPSAIAIPEA